jgi:hypothetical protein
MTDENPDLDRDEMQHNTDPGPEYSRTYRLFRWVSDNLLMIAGVTGIAAFALSSIIGVEYPRSVKILGISGLVSLVLLGRPTANKARSLLWDPSYVWLVDIDARYTKGGIFRLPAQQFREWSVEEGQIDWVSPELAFAKNVDLGEKTVEGCWRGTLSDRELMRTLQAVEECRGQLEDDAKRGFAMEAQAFSIIRNATRKAVLRVVSTFERNSLPDEGEGLTDEIDAAIEQFGLERKIREAESDEAPESDIPGVRIDLDDDLADLAAAGDGGAPADD